MSRSIHTTRRSLEEARRNHEPEEEVESLARHLRRKRRIKGLVEVEHQAALLPTGSGFSTAAVVTQQVTGRYIHFPVSRSTLEGLFEFLPAGVVDGLREITLDLRAGYQTSDDSDAWDPDPWLATPSYETFRGVYTGAILGTYFPDRSRIALYAYLYDPTHPGLPDWGLLLRVKAMETFLHELAHHFDHVRRVARGRWTADEDEKAEHFAEQRAYEWTVEYGIPYLEHSYPQEREELRRWMRHYGGVDVPLEAFVPKPDPIPPLFPPESAVKALMEEIERDHDLTECRLAFAEHLYFSGLYDHALESIRSVLDNDPDHLEGLTLEADIFVRQERYHEAAAIAELILRERGITDRICRVLMDAYEGMEQWSRVIEAANLVLKLPGEGEWDRLRALRHRAHAYLRLQWSEEARRDIEALECSGKRARSYHRVIQTLRKQLSELPDAGLSKLSIRETILPLL